MNEGRGSCCYLGESFPGRGNSPCKGPDVGAWVCSRNGGQDGTAGAAWVRGRGWGVRSKRRHSGPDPEGLGASVRTLLLF